MSRYIDPNKPLSKEDRQYLEDRNRQADIARYDRLAETADSGSGSGSDDYEEWTVEELRQELQDREQSTTGKKAELIARLRSGDEG